jgi:hypothetical protein
MNCEDAVAATLHFNGRRREPMQFISNRYLIHIEKGFNFVKDHLMITSVRKM